MVGQSDQTLLTDVSLNNTNIKHKRYCTGSMQWFDFPERLLLHQDQADRYYILLYIQKIAEPNIPVKSEVWKQLVDKKTNKKTFSQYHWNRKDDASIFKLLSHLSPSTCGTESHAFFVDLRLHRKRVCLQCAPPSVYICWLHFQTAAGCSSAGQMEKCSRQGPTVIQDFTRDEIKISAVFSPQPAATVTDW